MPNELSGVCNIEGLSVSGGGGIITGFVPVLRIVSDTWVAASSSVEFDYQNTLYPAAIYKITIAWNRRPSNKIILTVYDENQVKLYHKEWYAYYGDYHIQTETEVLLKQNWSIKIEYYNNDTKYGHHIYGVWATIYVLDATKEVS